MRATLIALTVVMTSQPVAAEPDSGATARTECDTDARAAQPERAAEAHREDGAESSRGKLVSALGLGSVYAGLSVWAYFAWYHDVPALPAFTVNGDGWFGRNTYAGGADKLGHFWANYVISRATTRLLMRGGWKRLPASLMASGLALGFFTFVEIKDGFYYQFSSGDMVGNAAGAALSVLMDNVPVVDELFDIRLQYMPSDEYMRKVAETGDVNIAEDYSGQTYLAALHLGAVRPLAASRWTRWTRYIDVVTGFESRNYKPRPADRDAVRRQSVFVGVSLNLQQVLAEAFGGPPRRTGHRLGHAVLEVVSPPYTTLRLAGASRSSSR